MRKISQTKILVGIGCGVLFLAATGCGGGGGNATGLAPLPASPASLNPAYHGGPLVQNARVATLFWGTNWDQRPGYVNRFFQALFANGRYMENLAQYSAGGYQVGNGEFGTTATDSVPPPATVTDAQVQTEIGAQVAAGHLPPPDANMLYFVFTPPSVMVKAYGKLSADSFDGYHGYGVDNQGRGFAYAVVVSTDDQAQLTTTISHELAEAVTAPQPTRDDAGWYNRQAGEIADIVQELYSEGRIGKTDYQDTLVGPDGTRYVVQKVWSVQDEAPVAFAGSAR
jgi:hypothetical protein